MPSIDDLTDDDALELAVILKYDIPDDDGVKEELIESYSILNVENLNLGHYLPIHEYFKGLSYLVRKGYKMELLLKFFSITKML